MKVFEKIKDTSAQGGAIPFFIGAMLAVIIALAVAWPVMDSAIYGGSPASGTLTLTGNVTTGETVTITNDIGGQIACFYFNTTGTGTVSPCHVVDVSSGSNTSLLAVEDLKTAINADATLTGVLTATNGTNTTTITSNENSGIYNLYGTTETVSLGSWASTVLSGGVSDATTMPGAAATLVDQLPLFLVLVLLMVFVKALI